MDAVERLRPQVAAIDVIDHHAHLLARPDTAIELREVLTESQDRAQIGELRWHPAHRRARRELAEVLVIEPTADAVAAARRTDYPAYVRGLLDRCRLEAMFVDDGFRFPGAMSLEQHAATVGRPVRRVVRLETEAEAAAPGAGWPPFDECRHRFQQVIADAVAGDDGAAAGRRSPPTAAASTFPGPSSPRPARPTPAGAVPAPAASPTRPGCRRSSCSPRDGGERRW